MPFAPVHRRPRAVVVVAVLGLHMLLLLGTAHLGLWRDRSPPPRQPAPLWLQLPAWVASADEAPARAHGPVHANAHEPPRTPAHAPAHPAHPIPSATPSGPQAITLTPPAADATPATTAPASVATPAAAASAPLRLDLPHSTNGRWSQAAVNAAVGPARLQRNVATLESRIALATGPGAWTEERIDDNRVRLRKGSVCIELYRSDIARFIDPWNQSASAKPAVGMACRE